MKIKSIDNTAIANNRFFIVGLIIILIDASCTYALQLSFKLILILHVIQLLKS